jgi:hypothetical protein
MKDVHNVTFTCHIVCHDELGPTLLSLNALVQGLPCQQSPLVPPADPTRVPQTLRSAYPPPCGHVVSQELDVALRRGARDAGQDLRLEKELDGLEDGRHDLLLVDAEVEDAEALRRDVLLLLEILTGVAHCFRVLSAARSSEHLAPAADI